MNHISQKPGTQVGSTAFEQNEKEEFFFKIGELNFFAKSRRSLSMFEIAVLVYLKAYILRLKSACFSEILACSRGVALSVCISILDKPAFAPALQGNNVAMQRSGRLYLISKLSQTS